MIFIILALLFSGLYLYLFSFIDLSNYFFFLWTPLAIIGGVLTIVILALLYIALCPTKNHKSKFKHYILWNFCSATLFLTRTKVEIVGKENIPTGGFVIMANHKSQMDPIIIYKTLHIICSAIGKQSLFSFWPMTKLSKIYKAIPLDRNNDRNAVKQIGEAIKLVKDEYPMIIFPEGGIKTRDTEEMVSLRAGAYKVPLKAQAGVLPISIIGSSKFIKKGLFKKINIKIIIHKYISYDEFKEMNTTMIGEMVEDIVNQGVRNENK